MSVDDAQAWLELDEAPLREVLPHSANDDSVRVEPVQLAQLDQNASPKPVKASVNRASTTRRATRKRGVGTHRFEDARPRPADHLRPEQEDGVLGLGDTCECSERGRRRLWRVS